MQPSLDDAIRRCQSSPTPCPQDRFEGRGIVICAGGTRYFTCAWVLISVLRHVHRTALPIQVWHLGRGEMSEEMRNLLLEEGVEIVDAEAVVAHHPARLTGGWPLKPYAIAQSRFREVLYLDADTVPLVDPQAAFGWAQYCEHGLLLWPDAVNIKDTNPIWARLGLEPVEQASIDSGVLLVDKARAWDILRLAVVLNEHSDELYDLIHGDKDTFLISARLLDKTFGFIPHRPFPLEWDMVQRDPAGEPFVHHRTGGKWLLHGPNRPLAAPALMPHCEAALAQLRERWSGHVFHAPDRSARARAEEARLVALRNVRIEDSGDVGRDLELLPGGRVGAGREVEQHWAVIERGDTLVLQLYGNGRVPIAALEKRDGGAWFGLGCEPGSEVVIREPADGAASPGTNDRVQRSAHDLVVALMQPAWFAIGFEAERALALEAALSLLNDAFDDTPEQIAARLTQGAMPAPWRGRLHELVPKLTLRRDARIALVRRQEKRRPRMLSPGHYAPPA
jgi:hypothetical protein